MERSIPNGVYSHALFPDWFKEVLALSQAKDGNLSFDDKFRIVFDAIQGLSMQRRIDLFDEFKVGLDIRSICTDTQLPVILTELYSNELHSALNILKDHFYGVALSTNKTIQSQLKTTLLDHYQTFKNTNNSGRVCPFCGLHEYSLLEGESKDDYDHWLYKAKYPIYSVNFSNLVPMCGKCNQTGVKGVADVLYNKTTGLRRRSFYPYDDNAGIDVKVANFNPVSSLPDEEKSKYPYGYFNLAISHNALGESDQVQTWIDVFNIQVRYNSYLSLYYNGLQTEFHEQYLPDHPEIILTNNLEQLRTIVSSFRSQLGNLKRRTGVEIDKAYLDFICKDENSYMLFTFCNIVLTV
ncbi:MULTISPECIES: hypothetical protein [unclassified Pedobacter]|uniref:hypothetical protein n=1 Tax=unclassified Pedobacter TaxID=2628915 RepID=UPI001E2A3DD6|nr:MULTISPECIES: hypothetical protein [unclassified Pedobacter]